MALIPPDAGIRMRMQTEANLLQPTAPAHEIPSDLQDLPPGRVFTARIQEALPDNTFRALVAGKTITLSLPEGAKAGDELELVVVDRSARSIIARQVEPGANQTAAAQPYPFTRLSPAAQLIGQLLPAEGKSAPPARLNGGQPLLETPPGNQAGAAQLAPRLAAAVVSSGLFYESHQAQWITGKLPLPQLLLEPQGQHSTQALNLSARQPNTLGTLPSQTNHTDPSAMGRLTVQVASPPSLGNISQAAGQPDLVSTSNLSHAITGDMEKIGPGGTIVESADTRNLPADVSLLSDNSRTSRQPNAANMGNLVQAYTGDAEKVGAGGTVTATSQAAQTSSAAQQIPEDLRPIVQQQLEAVATQRVFWHGEIWPQQQIDWEIEWQQRHEGDGGGEEESTWRTALSLTTPRLGKMNAALLLSADGVRITLATPHDASVTDLRDAAPRLADALSSAGVPLLAFHVKHEDEHPAGQG